MRTKKESNQMFRPKPTESHTLITKDSSGLLIYGRSTIKSRQVGVAVFFLDAAR